MSEAPDIQTAIIKLIDSQPHKVEFISPNIYKFMNFEFQMGISKYKGSDVLTSCVDPLTVFLHCSETHMRTRILGGK